MKKLLLLCPLLLSNAVFAAEKPKTTDKPAQPPVKGQVQMAGDNGQIGTIYTIGAEGPLNFTLNSAEFSATRSLAGEITIAPTAEQKLLILKATVHNPNKDLTNFDWGTLKLTAIDPNDVNHEAENFVVKQGTSETVTVDLKPAQKVDVFYVIRVPLKGSIPKLMVAHYNGGKVLRYDLRQVAKGLPAPFADSAEKSGANGLAEIKAAADTFYPMTNFDVKLVGTAYSDKKLGENELEDGKQFFVATITLKNGAATPQLYDGGTFTVTLTGDDDEKSDYNAILLKAKRDEAANGELKSGEEYTGRVFFALPKDVKAKTLTLSEGESRTYVFDVSNTK